MNSAELNERIRKLDNQFEFKPVPYIGWFWREVDFDAHATIGVCTMDDDGNFIVFYGFMQNNKWGYHEHLTTSEQMARLRQMCIIAAMTADEYADNAALLEQACRLSAKEIQAYMRDIVTGEAI